MRRIAWWPAALAGAAGGLGLVSGTASAHAGDDHPASVIGGAGLQLVAVVLVVGLVYWLTNRPAANEAPERAAGSDAGEAPAPRPPAAATMRRGTTGAGALVVTERLRPHRRSGPRHRRWVKG